MITITSNRVRAIFGPGKSNALALSRLAGPRTAHWVRISRLGFVTLAISLRSISLRFLFASVTSRSSGQFALSRFINSCVAQRRPPASSEQITSANGSKMLGFG